MSFDKEAYLKEKAIQFVNEITNPHHIIGLQGFKTKMKYYLSTLNNDIDKRAFVNYSIDILHQITEKEPNMFKDFKYVLHGYVGG